MSTKYLNIKLSKEVATNKAEYIYYVPADGHIVNIVEFIGNCPSDFNSFISLMWDYGTENAQLLWSMNMPQKAPTIEDDFIGDGVKKLALICDNSNTGSVFMSSYVRISVIGDEISTTTTTGNTDSSKKNNQTSSQISLYGIDTTTNVQNAIMVSPTTQEGSSTILISHDFCDKTTWYNDSVRVSTTETLETSDYLTYASDHTYWIDLSHGKVPYEHRMVTTYKPIIYIDDVETSTGFTVNYVNGTITFSSSQEGKTVKAKYSYATTSAWKIAPDSGKGLKIIGTIVKFAKNVTIGAEQYISFQVYVNGSAYGSPTIYKNIADFIKCATGNPAVIPSFGEITNDIIWIPFDYVTSKDLKSSLAMDIRIKINDDIPMTGEWGVVCAECISKSET